MLLLLCFGVDQEAQRITSLSELIEEKDVFRGYRTILLAVKDKPFGFLSKAHRGVLLKQIDTTIQTLDHPYNSKRAKARALTVIKALTAIKEAERQLGENDWSPPKPKRTSTTLHQKVKPANESEKLRTSSRSACSVKPAKIKTWIEMNKRKFYDIDNFSLECEGQSRKKSKVESTETKKIPSVPEPPPSPPRCSTPPSPPHSSEPLSERKPSFHENTVPTNRPQIAHRVFFTGFNAEETQLYKGIVSLLGGTVCEGDFSDEVTHVVWKGKSRTTLTLAGFASGCWIVTAKWLRKSLTEKRFVSELGYGWKREWGLFVKWRVCLHGLRDDKLIPQLVFLGGGQVVDETQTPTHIITATKEQSRAEGIKMLSINEFYDFIHPPEYKEG